MRECITVIIPVYNTAEMIERCLTSVLCQTHRNLDIIIVDDGSTDDSSQLIQKIAINDKRVRIISKKNKGQGVARNWALEIAHGDFLFFIDSDDYIMPNAIEKMLTIAVNGNSDIVLCGTRFESANHKNNGDEADQNSINYDVAHFRNSEELLFTYFTTNRIQTAPWGKLYRKYIFDGIRFPDYRAREDYAIMHRLLGRCKCADIIDEKLYVQVVRVGSTEYSRFHPKKLAVLDCDRDIQQYIQEQYPQLYKYVGRNYADALRNCIRDIVVSFSTIRYHKIYLNLLDELRDEVNLLNSQNCGYDLSTHSFILKHKMLFLIKESLKGVTAFLYLSFFKK